MKSMTGFSQGRFEFENLSLNIIIKTLNHRYFELSIKGTGLTPQIEKLVRNSLKGKILRGKIEIIFDLFETDPQNWKIQFNDYLLEEILNKVISLKKKYRDNITLSLESFLRIPAIFYLDQKFENFSEEKLSFIQNSVNTVLNDLIKSRAEEGNFIKTNLYESINIIEENIKSVELLQDDIETNLFKKYKEKIARFMSDFEVDERRLVQEAAIAADRSCIKEEINRLSIHSIRFKKILDDGGNEAKGKEADFLAQEMQREIHTISSKTASMEIHESVLKIRREIEKIKQQVQNIE